MVAGFFAFNPEVLANKPFRKYIQEARCTIYRAVNGKPDMNLAKVIELMGGIEGVIGSEDIVVIKPNVQWWNQGAPNLAALKSFIKLIMERSGGFNGEVVVAENCHRGPTPWESSSSGWANPFQWNSDIPQVHNMNDLTLVLKKSYGDRFSVCHWIDVQSGNKRVSGPADGMGYVYCDGSTGTPLLSLNNDAKGNDYRATIMTYPIFKTEKGTIIDFKNGIWRNGAYIDQPLRFINFAALNHHSRYSGFTCSIKNYMGIADLSGGPDPYNDGHLTKSYYNFHSFAFDKWESGPKPGMLGSAIGVFLDTIRKADLNIITAEWTGIASRITHPIAHTSAVLACSDPVALDYHATKYVLYPNSKLAVHDPDNKNSSSRQYLTKCSEKYGGIIDERYVEVKSFDFASNTFKRIMNLRS